MLFIIAIILFICNFLNVILYGIEEATKKPEFFIMVSIALIWLFVYTYIINKVDSKRNMGLCYCYICHLVWLLFYWFLLFFTYIIISWRRILEMKIKKLWSFLLIIAISFYLVPLMIKDTGIGMLVLLVVLPIISFICSMIYGMGNTFHPLFSLCCSITIYSHSLFIL